MKLVASISNEATVYPIPPLPSGGPIEASLPSALTRPGPGFHRYQAVAPLKLRVTAASATSDPRIPPLPSGGPIEAPCHVVDGWTEFLGFHRYQAVAPLKPVVVVVDWVVD